MFKEIKTLRCFVEHLSVLILRLEEESLNVRLQEELRSFVEPGPGVLVRAPNN